MCNREALQVTSGSPYKYLAPSALSLCPIIYCTGGKHKARGPNFGPPPCFIQPSTLFLAGSRAKLLAPR